MATLSHKIHINAPKERIHEALSTTEGLKSWYTPLIEGEVRQGETAVFRFTGKEPFRWKFVEITPPSLVRWECVEEPGAARGTTVTFRLSDKGGWTDRSGMRPRGLAGEARSVSHLQYVVGDAHGLSEELR